jgi:hypothetical protein
LDDANRALAASNPPRSPSEPKRGAALERGDAFALAPESVSFRRKGIN